MSVIRRDMPLVHPAAEPWRKLRGKKFDAFVTDIKENGQKQPIVMIGDAILDGRNRWLACKKLGIKPNTVQWSGTDPRKDAISLNAHRRHDDESQRAMVAARMATRPKGRPGNRSKDLFIPTQEQAAALLVVSEPSVKRARIVLESNLPELIEAVDDGAIAVTAAAPLVKLEPGLRAETIKRVLEGKAKNPRDAIRQIKTERKTSELKIAKAKLAKQQMSTVADLRHCSMQDLLVSALEYDAIITDPPYPEEFLPLYGEMARLAARSLKPDGIVAVMCGQSYLPQIIADMSKHLKYRWCFAYLTPGGQAVQLWDRKINTFWKPILIFGGGDQWSGDVVKSDVNDNDKRFHGWGQSESGIRYLVEALTKPGARVCDPFMGAGTTGVVCVATGRFFVGCDIDAEHVETTRGRIAEVLNV